MLNIYVNTHAPGASEAHAVAHTCNRNYGDKATMEEEKKIKKNHQNDNMHCSARAFRLIMEWLPWRR